MWQRRWGFSMTPYGASIIALMAAGSLPWSYAFEALGRIARTPRLPLLLTGSFLGFSTFAYLQMQLANAPESRGLAIILVWVATMHLISITLAGLVWAILGQRAARAFLNAPQILLLLALALALLTLVLGFTFAPTR